MRVMETDDKISSDMLSPVIGRKGRQNERHNWFKERLVVINGKSGKGVDLFFALEKTITGEYGVVTDQREPVAFTNHNIDELLKKALIVPDVISDKCTSVACLFSFCFTPTRFDPDVLPIDSVALTQRETRAYHGSLLIHHSSTLFI